MSDKQNKVSTHQPSYFAIIPANVRYNKNIEPNAKLLYGELTSLCQVEGFCWANNSYFAKLYDVDSRTIGRWLKSLVDEGFIQIEHSGNNFCSDRKIYLFQNNFTEDKNVLPPMTKMSNRSIYRKQQEEVVCADSSAVADSPLEKKPVFSVEKSNSSKEKYTIERNDIFLHAIRKNKKWTTEEIEESWQTLVDYPNPVNDPFAFCEGVIKNKRKLKGLTQCKSLKKTKFSNATPQNTKKCSTEKGSLVRPFQNWKLTPGKLTN